MPAAPLGPRRCLKHVGLCELLVAPEGPSTPSLAVTSLNMHCGSQRDFNLQGVHCTMMMTWPDMEDANLSELFEDIRPPEIITRL